MDDWADLQKITMLNALSIQTQLPPKTLMNVIRQLGAAPCQASLSRTT